MPAVETNGSLLEGPWAGLRQRRFSILLIVLVALLAGSPILAGWGRSAGWFEVLMHLITLLAILSLCFERHQRLFAIVTGTPTILFSIGGHAFSGAVSTWVLFVGHLCAVVFLFGAAGLIVRSLFKTSSVTFESVYGAVCGYLFLGLGWAVLYTMMERTWHGSFQINPVHIESGQAAQMLPHVLTYYSFVTLTTVGFGDVTPISPAARTFAWMEAVTGQFYLAVVVAGIVSIMVAMSSRRQSVGSSSESK